MCLLPKIDDSFLDDDIEDELEEIEEEEDAEPSYTYAMNYDNKRIVGKCDKLEAVRQAIFKMLSTERYECPLYSWDYGVELKDLFGMPKNYCMAEIERQFTEALLIDDRITDVHSFSFSFPDKSTIAVSFSVNTIYGDTQIEREVSV